MKNTMNHKVLESNSSYEERVEEIGVRPLAEILKDESPALIKIDAEGFETAVIEGASKTLQNPSLNTVILELNGSC